MVKSIESATVHSLKNSTVGHLFRDFGEKKKSLEHWVGNWEQFDWSPLGGCIPSVRIVLLWNESARGDQSKELRSCACAR